MATILGLALKINADASGVPRQLTTVERALQGLDREAAKVTGVFDRFSQSSAAAAEVQQRFQAEIDALTRALEDRAINGQQFADGFAAIRAEAAALADTFAEGARVTEQYRTEEDRRAETLQRLSNLLEAGAISEDTYARASAEASGANAAAAKAEQARASALASAARIIQANLTPQERYDQQVQELRGHLEAGRLSQEQFNRAAARAKSDLDNVGKSATNTDKSIDSLNKKVSVLAAIEIGRVLVDGFQLLSNAFTSATSQITSLVTSVNA
jgi:DNA repair exonuclease SbcCD ATPase subunit